MAQGQGGMSVPMQAMPGDPAQAQGMPDPAEGIGQILAELQAGGVDIQPGPNGTIILSGIPAEILAQLGASETAPAG
jgi:hypothetical protein